MTNQRKVIVIISYVKIEETIPGVTYKVNLMTDFPAPELPTKLSLRTISLPGVTYKVKFKNDFPAPG